MHNSHAKIANQQDLLIRSVHFPVGKNQLRGGRPIDGPQTFPIGKTMTDAISRISPTPDSSNKVNSPAQVLMASLVGTTIEFFDFYVYATAAVLVFPTLFFPNSDPTTALLSSFATFSIAFFARPFGAADFWARIWSR